MTAVNAKSYNLYMKYIFKSAVFIYLIALTALRGWDSQYQMLIITIIIVLNIYAFRIRDSMLVSVLSFFLIAAGIWVDPSVSILLCIPSFDFSYRKQWIWLALVPISGAVISNFSNMPQMVFMCFIYAMLGLSAKEAECRQQDYKRKIDEERRLRYELEELKSKLSRSAGEAIHLAEIAERNRIARDIHDNVGHGITGILFQLRLARKLYEKDEKESAEILDNSIDALAETITLLRDTVHNIKPKELLGIDYIKNIIDQFNFCEVKFKVLGDAGLLQPVCLEFAAAAIKEALTNASKYSCATQIFISMDINENIMRLEIRDNGKGAFQIKEGMGIKGMRERAGNIGGTVSVSSGNGFLIVCVIPVGSRRSIV